jgi:hypothetical protein
VREDAEPPRYELKVSLRLRHDEPRELGDVLRGWGFQAGREWRADEPRRTPNDKTLPGVERESYAYVRLALPEIGTFAGAIAAILDSLEPFRPELRSFVDEGGRAELFVSWAFEANSGGTVAWGLAQRLAAFRLNLALDVYP